MGMRMVCVVLNVEVFIVAQLNLHFIYRFMYRFSKALRVRSQNDASLNTWVEFTAKSVTIIYTFGKHPHNIFRDQITWAHYNYSQSDATCQIFT